MFHCKILLVKTKINIVFACTIIIFYPVLSNIFYLLSNKSINSIITSQTTKCMARIKMSLLTGTIALPDTFLRGEFAATGPGTHPPGALFCLRVTAGPFSTVSSNQQEKLNLQYKLHSTKTCNQLYPSQLRGKYSTIK